MAVQDIEFLYDRLSNDEKKLGASCFLLKFYFGKEPERIANKLRDQKLKIIVGDSQKILDLAGIAQVNEKTIRFWIQARSIPDEEKSLKNCFSKKIFGDQTLMDYKGYVLLLTKKAFFIKALKSLEQASPSEKAKIEKIESTGFLERSQELIQKTDSPVVQSKNLTEVTKQGSLISKIKIEQGNEAPILLIGYPITETFLLTASIAELTNDRVQNSFVTLQIFAGDQKSSWLPIDKFIKPKDDTLAVTLIHCSAARQSLPLHTSQWSSASLKSGQPWASLACASDSDHPKLMPLSGDIVEFTSTELRLRLDADIQRQTLRESLRGAPVLVDDCLVGIVTGWADGASSTELIATSVRAILNDERLGAVLKPCQRRCTPDQVKVQVATVLEKDSGALEALQQAVLEEQGTEVERSGESVAEALLFMEVKPFLTTIHAAQQMTTTDRVWTVLSEIAQMMLPLQADEQAVDQVRLRKGQMEVELLELSTDLKTVAEVIMAAADGRRVGYRRPFNSLKRPEGKYNIADEDAPETGYENNDNDYYQAWDQHLHLKIYQNDNPNADTDLDPYSIEDRIDSICDDLKVLAEDGKTLYVVFKPVSRTSEREIALKKARWEGLQQRYPELVVIVLQLDGKRMRRERQDYVRLNAVLFDNPHQDQRLA